MKTKVIWQNIPNQDRFTYVWPSAMAVELARAAAVGMAELMAVVKLVKFSPSEVVVSARERVGFWAFSAMVELIAMTTIQLQNIHKFHPKLQRAPVVVTNSNNRDNPRPGHDVQIFSGAPELDSKPPKPSPR